MIRVFDVLVRIVVRMMLFYLVVIGLVATGGFAGYGPLAEDLSDEEVPFLAPTIEAVSNIGSESPVDLDNQTVAQNATVADEQAVEQLIHENVNTERTAEGLDPLETDADLRRVARNHSADMIADGYVGHESPDGVTPADRLSAAGCSAGGENVAQTWIDRPVDVDGQRVVVENETELATHLVAQWMASPGHRENILRESFTESGVGVVITANNKVYATHNFCAGSVGGIL